MLPSLNRSTNECTMYLVLHNSDEWRHNYHGALARALSQLIKQLVSCPDYFLPGIFRTQRGKVVWPGNMVSWRGDMVAWPGDMMSLAGNVFCIGDIMSWSTAYRIFVPSATFVALQLDCFMRRMSRTAIDGNQRWLGS